MTLLHSIRKSLNLTQEEMATHCGLCRLTWLRLEAGLLLPSAAEAAKIQKLCAQPVPHAGQTLSKANIRAWFQPPRFAHQQVNPSHWHKLNRSKGFLFKRVSQSTRDWMRLMLPCESTCEACAWMQFAQLGALPVLANPHELGYQQHPIVDSLGQALGARYLAGLQGKHGDLLYALWPQVHVRTATTNPRLDALLWIRNKRYSVWVDLEVDGAGHNPKNDKYRDEHLAMPTLRFSQNEVDRMRVAQLFVERAHERLSPAAP